MKNNFFVLGGGLSSMSFLHNFKNGEKNVFEGANSLGGRINTLNISSSTIELGAQFFSRGDANIWSLVERLGLGSELNEIFLSDFSVYFEDKLISLKKKQPGQVSMHEVEELAKFYSFLVSLDKGFFLNPKGELINEDFFNWYSKNIGMDSVWFPEALCRAITFSTPKEISAFFGLIVCATFFDKVYGLKGGMTRIIDSLTKASMAKICTNSIVEGIEFEEGRAKKILVNKKEIAVGKKDFVVSGLPALELKKIVSEKKISKQLDKIKYAGSTFALFQTKKKLLKDWSGILFPEKGQKVSAVMEETKKFSNPSDKGFLSVILPYRKRKTEEEDVETIIGSLEGLVPDLRKNIEKKWVRQWDYGLPTLDKDP
ncbi:FAD-dependent oxidoreductase, partial [Patescibacteria group bacterium]|nr:FAD-dependent oxidoreductase [Patescibacteria group bacterium]